MISELPRANALKESEIISLINIEPCIDDPTLDDLVNLFNNLAI